MEDTEKYLKYRTFLNLLKSSLDKPLVSQDLNKQIENLPNSESINVSFYLLELFENLKITPSFVDYCYEGGIGITFNQNKKFSYIEVLNVGEIVFLTDIEGKNRETWTNNTNEIDLIKGSVQIIFKHLVK